VSTDDDRRSAAHARHPHFHAAVLRELVRGGGLERSSRVLEIGAGTAAYAPALSELVGCECREVEPSAVMRGIVQRGVHSAPASAGGDEALPFAAGSFDFAFCVNVVHRVGDPPSLFREAFRVLDDDGAWCVATESHDMIRNRFVLADYFPDTVAADLARYPRVDDLRRMAEAAGFDEWYECVVRAEVSVESADLYAAKAFPSLHLVSDAAFDRGLERLTSDLERGPLTGIVPVLTLLWASK
jgi:SAM-dependent methyltransferase